MMRLASSPSAKGQKGSDDSNTPLDDLGAIAQHHSKQQQRSHPHYPPRPHHPVISQQERESLDAELSDMLELLPGDLLGSSNNDTVAAPESVSPATQQARSPPFSQKWSVPSPDVVPSSANWEQGSGATDHRQQQQFLSRSRQKTRRRGALMESSGAVGAGAEGTEHRHL